MGLVLLPSYYHGFEVLQTSLLLDTLTLEYYNFRRLLGAGGAGCGIQKGLPRRVIMKKEEEV